MRLRDHYDWVVLGSHPGALLSASLVARLGLSVLVLPLAPCQTLTLSLSGQYFDPEPNFLIGLGRVNRVEGLLSQCLGQLGILPYEEKLIDTENRIVQVLTPRVRMLLGENESLHHELQREFGKSVSKQLGLVHALKQTENEYLTYWQNLPKRLTLSTKRKSVPLEPSTLKELRKKIVSRLKSHDTTLNLWLSSQNRASNMAQFIGDPSLKEAFTGLWYGVTSGVNKDPKLSDLLHLFSLTRTAGSFKGGMSAYREFLLNLARRLGVHIPIKIDCRRLFVERGRFAGVQVTGRGNMIAAAGGILGCTLEKAYPRVIYTGRAWMDRKKKSLKPAGWRFTIALTVHPESIPVRMLHRSVWQEKDAPALEVEVVHPSNYNVSDSNSCIIYIRTFMPFTLESLDLRYQKLVGSRMIRQVMEIFPFLEFHVKKMYPDIRQGATGVLSKSGRPDQILSNELTELYGFASLEAIPDNLLVFSGEGVGSSSGIEGLFIASEESYPSLGSLGPTTAALEATAWLAHRLGLSGPFV